MAMLTVAGFEVFILPGTQITEVKHGDIDRAYSGKMRSDVRASHRVGRISASIFDTANEALALRAILNTPGPVLLDGDFIGGAAYFHVTNQTYSAITGDRWKFDFDVAETVDSVYELLFTLHGDALGAYTFTRSGAIAKFTPADGILVDEAVNIPRQEWEWSDATLPYPDTPYLLVEAPAFINLVDSDDFTAWTDQGTPPTPTTTSDPAGGSTAYTIEDADGAAVEAKFRVVSFTGDAVKVVAWVVRENTMASAGNQSLVLFDSTATADRIRLNITAWVSGKPTITAAMGTHLGSRYVGNGYWAVYGLSTSVTAANTNAVFVQPAETDTATGKIDVFRVNAYDEASPPWSILDASETKPAETFYRTFSPVPQAMCGVVDFRELESPNFADQYIFAIGAASPTAPALQLYRPNATDGYLINHDTGSAVTATVDLNPSWGDRVQLFWWLYSDGSVNIAGRTQTLGSSTWSAITTGTQSGALALKKTWSDTRIYFGSSGVTSQGSQMYNGAVMLKGSSYTTTYLLDWIRARLNARDVMAVVP